MSIRAFHDVSFVIFGHQTRDLEGRGVKLTPQRILVLKYPSRDRVKTFYMSLMNPKNFSTKLHPQFSYHTMPVTLFKNPQIQLCPSIRTFNLSKKFTMQTPSGDKSSIVSNIPFSQDIIGWELAFNWLKDIENFCTF